MKENELLGVIAEMEALHEAEVGLIIGLARQGNPGL